jgi:hypothetical protein
MTRGEESWMIDSPRLLADLRKQLATLESDLRSRASDPGIADALRSEWQATRTAGRTAATYGEWRDEQLTQVGAAWLIGMVFMRFCEDNRLIDLPYLAGPGDRMRIATERQQAFYEHSPHGADRNWIVAGFEDMSAASSVASALFDRNHNPMWRVTPSHEAAKAVLAFWRSRGEGEYAALVHDFTDSAWDTRFLGNLYQDLSEREKSAYALLKTPEFVEQFILDHTLEPAIEDFGLAGLRIIDPACGSGTFLLGTFRRLLDRWGHQIPTVGPWDRIGSALASIHGVDKNPIAVSITRFRLMIAAMRAGGARRLVDVPELSLIVATGDSLLHGRRAPAAGQHQGLPGLTEPHYQRSEDVGEFSDADLLDAGSYHAVVGNPPYITPKDKAEAEAYRAAYPACVGTYALTVPFIIRFFGLAVHGGEERGGYVGLLSANSFMKREFGRGLLEQFFPTVDLTHVIDTSGAFIPGHGIPTVILFGRGRRPQHAPVRAIVGRRGEPAVPADPAHGYVWKSILSGIDRAAYEDGWTQGLEIDRSVLSSFPWNLADATTTEIIRQMESGVRLGDRVARIGYFANTGSDDLFTAPTASFRRMKAETKPLIPVITGSGVRDWTVVSNADGAVFSAMRQAPLDSSTFPRHQQRLWPYRTVLGHRRNYSGRSYFEDGRAWYTWHHIADSPSAHSWLIVFPWVSTHNHFAVLRERAAPLNSAPVIRLPQTASDADVLQLAALLNSSLACFWLKQHSNSKGQPRTDQTGTGEPWTMYYEFTGTRLGDLPLPPDRWSKDRWSVHAEQLDELAQELTATDPRSLLGHGSAVTHAELDAAHSHWHRARATLISLQEELDWEIYGRYGLISEADELYAPGQVIPDIAPGERAFEIVLARRIARGQINSIWFERHQITPICELPSHWPAQYRQVVEKRIQAIERRPDIGLVERPEYKRRWATDPWGKRERDAIRNWLLDRCEDPDLWYETDYDGKPKPRPLTVGGLAARLSENQGVVAMAARYAGVETDLAKIIAEIIQDEHVPFLAALCYTGQTGLGKRARWEQTWELQRSEDATGGIAGQEIPVPPKYISADFTKSAYWLHRGKFDVPNERFVSYSRMSTHDETIIGWAGWSYSERACILIGLIDEHKRFGNDADDYVIPWLAGIHELLPWLRQWHQDPEPPLWKDSPAEEVRAYLEKKRVERGLLDKDLTSWRPPKPKRGRPRKARRAPRLEHQGVATSQPTLPGAI